MRSPTGAREVLAIEQSAGAVKTARGENHGFMRTAVRHTIGRDEVGEVGRRMSGFAFLVVS